MPHALKKSETGPLPRHIAIIMDGNRRWARAHKVSRLEGHKKGIEAARRCVEACLDRGIENLTLYAFSSENWKRPREEVDSLMGLLRLYLGSELERMGESGVRLHFIGSRNNLPKDINSLLKKAENATRANTRMNLTMAINYGSHLEILEAIRAIAARVSAGALAPEDITEEDVNQALETRDVPDPDLVIRTGGEKRLSNFLLWQSAYSELVFLDEFWPDFDKSLLDQALLEYRSRDRRFGARTD